jgi:hypothetical protein
MKSKTPNKNKRQAGNWLGSFLLLTVLLVLSPSYLPAQTFDSGSDGSNGALNLTLAGADPDGIIIFDPQAMGLVPDENNAYHFTTINVESGVTVKLRADILGVGIPVIWLATGDVTIDGTLDLNGERGHAYNATGIVQAAIGGAGGFNGGTGRREFRAPTVGQGPGGSDVIRTSVGNYRVSGAGHANAGGSNDSLAGSSYGNNFLIPLLGGSGGAGSGDSTATESASASQLGAGGGAGGGAVLIASSTQIQVNGSITCAGGNGGVPRGGLSNSGGGGSGGSIRLMANTLVGSGVLSAAGGAGIDFSVGAGSVGRIRQEIFDNQFTGATTPNVIASVPISVFPKSAIPSVRVVRISGLSVPPNATASIDLPLAPTGSFVPADMVIDENDTVTLEIEASDIPLGTVVNLTLYSGAVVLNIISTPLVGTLESSTATATVAIPTGFSRFAVEASW